jgi:RNA polymerase sigma-70 factor (ECF subfamily)
MRRPAPKPSADTFALSAADSAHRDQELVARIRAGDERAAEALYRIHVQAVTSLASRLLGRSHDAEDVVQDAFVAAFGRLPQLRDGSLFRAWLMRITVHEVHRRYRRRKLMRALGMDGAPNDVGLAELAAPSLSSEMRAELAALDRALLRLPARERIAWMLRHVEGCELTEIASACHASLASVKRWIARADARVRAHVSEESRHA